MNSKNYHYGGDIQSDNDPVVAYPVNPTAPPAMSNCSVDIQPSVFRFQNEGAIWWFNDIPTHILTFILFFIQVEPGNT